LFAKHPLDQAREKLGQGNLADAVRLAMAAEVDAISFYLQVARAADDPAVRRVFEDVAREEMTHLGEFLALLYRLDPGHREEVEKGFREVAELLGEPPGAAGGMSAATPAPAAEKEGAPANALGVEELFLREARRLRILRANLSETAVGPGVDYAPVQVIAYSGSAVAVEAEAVVPLREVAIEFLIPQRLAERSRLMGTYAYSTIVAQAARRLVASEERLILESLLNLEGALEAHMGAWERPGEAVDDIAKAIARMEAEGVTGPYVLLLSPQRYAKLLTVHERTGVMELARLEKLAKVVRHPLLTQDKAILAPRDPAVLDIVVGVDTRIDDLGLESGAYRYRAWETLALRVHYPRGVTVLTHS